MKRRSALAALLATLTGCGGGGGGSDAPAPAVVQEPAAPPPPPPEFVVVQSAAQVDIFMKGSNPASNRYLRYRLQRLPIAAINSDVWRLDEVWETERTGAGAFTQLLMVCSNGEVETAIRQAGKSDFMGGTNHGDEALSSAAMLIDGAPVALGGSGSFVCRRLEFVQASDLFEVDTVPAKSRRVATASKRWVFENLSLELSQHITWERAITLEACYLTMLPLLRTSGSTQVSDRGFRAPLFAPEDLSSAGFMQLGTTSSLLRASGPSGYSGEVEILEGWDKPGRKAFFSNSPLYNKLYFDYTGTGYVTTVGEDTTARARIRVDTRN